MLRAVHRASAKVAIQLRIIGRGPADYVAFLDQLCTELDIRSHVRFEPAVPRAALIKAYQDADVFCFPTLADTYGVALMEAMSSACAVIVTDTGGPGEIVRAGDGIKIAMANPEQYVEDFSDAIVSLAEHPELRQRYGIRARQRMVQDHDWGRIGDQLLRIYDEFAAAHVQSGQKSSS